MRELVFIINIPVRRVPPPPMPRTLPAALPLPAVLDFDVRAPYSASYPTRLTRPSHI